MVIGTVTIGKMKTAEGEFIGTQFFMLGLPLIPLSSMYVTNTDGRQQQGVQLGLYGPSVLKGYAEYWLLAIGVFSFILKSSILPFLPFIILGASGYFFFLFGRSTPDESALRVMLKKTTGLSALPEWLGREVQSSIQKDLISRLKLGLNSPTLDWKTLAREDAIAPQVVPILFSIAAYEKAINDSPENETLYEKLTALYKTQMQTESVS